MTTTFLPIVPATVAPALPTCPDGSGDLWWDDASYLRYQSEDFNDYSPAFIDEATTPNFCDGPIVDDCPF